MGTIARESFGRRVAAAAVRVCGAALMLAVAACTSTAAFRTHLSPPGTDCEFAADQACAADVLYEVVPPAATRKDANAPTSVHMGFVEFDDQGYLLEPALKDELMQRIQQMAEQKPLLMIVYAHGWKHNASADDTDVLAFRQLLLRVAAADHEVCARSACVRRHVVGVYLGWRGLSATAEPFKELSFWTRKSRAHRVGTDGATEVLSELAKIKATSNHLRGANEDNESRLVLTGHSFGGALLYSATEQLLTRDAAFPVDGTIRPNVADLVVLVNPAFEAARFHSIQRKAANLAFDKTQPPLLAVFTSKTDTATKYAFPFGRGLSTLFQRYTSADQRNQNVTALGHYVPFRTHDLLLDADKRAHPEAMQLDPLPVVLCRWRDFQSGHTDAWNLGGLSLTRQEHIRTEAQRQNPYMVVSVDGGVIAGHSGIWGDLFSEFLYLFVAMQSAKPGQDCEAAKTSTPVS